MVVTVKKIVLWRRTAQNRSGLGHAISQAIADAGIILGFLMTQVVRRKFSTVFGFESEAEASKCAALIRKATAARKR